MRRCCSPSSTSTELAPAGAARNLAFACPASHCSGSPVNTVLISSWSKTDTNVPTPVIRNVTSESKCVRQYLVKRSVKKIAKSAWIGFGKRGPGGRPSPESGATRGGVATPLPAVADICPDTSPSA
jgi:hypothetical protein